MKRVVILVSLAIWGIVPLASGCWRSSPSSPVSAEPLVVKLSWERGLTPEADYLDVGIKGGPLSTMETKSLVLGGSRVSIEGQIFIGMKVADAAEDDHLVLQAVVRLQSKDVAELYLTTEEPGSIEVVGRSVRKITDLDTDEEHSGVDFVFPAGRHHYAVHMIPE